MSKTSHNKLHNFMVYYWPCSLLKQKCGWICNFIWTGSHDTSKMVSHSWRQVCAPKDFRVLGIHELSLLNHTTFLKVTWNILTSSSIWCEILKGRFQLSVYNWSQSYSKSIILTLVPNCHWVVGDRWWKKDQFMVL